MMKELSHLDKDNQPGMVNISDKKETERKAVAQGTINVGSEVMKAIKADDFTTKKGSIFQTAVIAGTMAVKKTSELIPFCHPIPISGCKININHSENSIYVRCTVSTYGKTGVEMEAINGVSNALITIYDMCKAISHNMEISDIKLIEKTGGKSDYYGKTS